MTAVPWFPGVSFDQNMGIWDDHFLPTHSPHPLLLEELHWEAGLTASEFCEPLGSVFLSGILLSGDRLLISFNHRALRRHQKSIPLWLWLAFPEKIRKPLCMWHFTDDNTFTNILSFDPRINNNVWATDKKLRLREEEADFRSQVL